MWVCVAGTVYTRLELLANSLGGLLHSHDAIELLKAWRYAARDRFSSEALCLSHTRQATVEVQPTFKPLQVAGGGLLIASVYVIQEKHNQGVRTIGGCKACTAKRAPSDLQNKLRAAQIYVVCLSR